VDRGVERLGLGTVQFGLDYGVTNRRGKVTRGEAERIVGDALAAGIRIFDTASAYGDSETVLGEVLSHTEARIVTKLPALPGEIIDAAAIDGLRRSFEQSLTRLRRSRIHGLLLHRPDDLTKPGAERLARLLEDLRSAGLCRKVGVSAYDSAQIEAAEKALPVELVQVPMNLLDQRLLRNGALAQLKTHGCEVHVRSAFLQGLLLGASAPLPAYFERYATALERVHAVAQEAKMGVLELALRFLLNQSAIDHVIVGVTRADELSAIIAAASRPADLPSGLDKLACDDPGLINPSLWPPSAPAEK
jgi:aryl-alcohol dehydrogenase-like predicted oxidoreductase